MKKTYTLGILGLLLVSLIAGSVFAFEGEGSSMKGMKEMISEENREAVKDAIANNDFDAWVTAMTNELTEERFNKLVEMYELMEERRETREEIHAALDANDYDAWVAAIADLEIQPRIAEVINEDNFHLAVELHEAKENGDKERAREILEELGINPGGFKAKYQKYMHPFGKGRTQE